MPKGGDGTFYALHIRRGDFEFKAVKISAGEIVENLRGSIIFREAPWFTWPRTTPTASARAAGRTRNPVKINSVSRAASGRVLGRLCEEWVARVCPQKLYGGDTRLIRTTSAWSFCRSFVCPARPPASGRGFRTGFFGAAGVYSTAMAVVDITLWPHVNQHYYHSTGKVFCSASDRPVRAGLLARVRIGWTDDGGAIFYHHVFFFLFGAISQRRTSTEAGRRLASGIMPAGERNTAGAF